MRAEIIQDLFNMLKGCHFPGTRGTLVSEGIEEELERKDVSTISLINYLWINIY